MGISCLLTNSKKRVLENYLEFVFFELNLPQEGPMIFSY